MSGLNAINQNTMKKLILLFALGFFVKTLPAQNYIPLPMDSAYWRVDFWAVQPPNCACTISYLYATNGDTIIGTHVYTKIIRTGPSECFCGSSSGLSNALIRQDTLARKIFIYNSDSLRDEILYDFTQQVGDTVNSVLSPGLPASPPAIISALDSILIDGVYHRQLHIQPNGWLTTTVQFIEGVGSTLGLLEPLMNFESGGELMCASHNGQAIFPDTASACSDVLINLKGDQTIDKWSAVVFPNPIQQNEIRIQFNRVVHNADLVMYDLLGHAIEKMKISNTDNVLIRNKHIQSGMYIFKIVADDNSVLTLKVQVE